MRYGVRLELLCWSGAKVRRCALAGGAAAVCDGRRSGVAGELYIIYML